MGDEADEDEDEDEDEPCFLLVERMSRCVGSAGRVAKGMSSSVAKVSAGGRESRASQKKVENERGFESCSFLKGAFLQVPPSAPLLAHL